jgi:UDP-glucuronate decarboxylase
MRGFQMALNAVVREDLDYIHARIGGRSEWDEATVLVTGCAGFLGYYLMQYLVRYAAQLHIHKVIGLDNFLFGQPSWLKQLAEADPSKLELVKFDISRDRIRDVDGAGEARYVIHGASIASPTFYRQHPLETIDANIWGLRSLLEFYRGSSTLRGLLFFSSSEIYGDPDSAAIPTTEDYRGYVACLGPRACYDESKRFGETLCYVFSRQYGLPVTIARPFNNFGPGMRVDDRRLPADFARCVLESRDIVILSDGTPTRTFCYVADAEAGYLLCLLHREFDAFNIGTERPEIMVRDFAELYRDIAADIFGYRGRVEYSKSSDSDYLADNPNRRCPVIQKARDKLGYNPQIEVGDGVRRYLRHLQSEAGRAQ